MIIQDKSRGEKSSLEYVIQNIVLKSSLKPAFNQNLKLDLNLLKKKLSNVEYNPNRFPGLFLRNYNPKCVIIIFRNGKLIITGIKSFDDIEKIIENLIKKLKSIIKIDLDAKNVETIIVNIVITANFYKRINLDLSAIKLENSIYEPEVFPGLVYNCQNPIKCVFLIFSTGKLVLTGIHKESLINSALINLGRLLKKEDLFL
jgi:transcription initiation factor TFIID TATA-box-binding protein